MNERGLLHEQSPANDSFATEIYHIDGVGRGLGLSRLSDNYILRGCLKMPGYKASEIPRNKAYIGIRRNNAG